MGTLTNGAGAPACVLLQELDDVGLLGRGAAAADHGRALAGQLHELVLIVLQADLGEGRARAHSQGQTGRAAGRPGLQGGLRPARLPARLKRS